MGTSLLQADDACCSQPQSKWTRGWRQTRRLPPLRSSSRAVQGMAKRVAQRQVVVEVISMIVFPENGDGRGTMPPPGRFGGDGTWCSSW